MSVTRDKGQLASARLVPGGAELPEGDYVSPGLSSVFPDACFPNMMVGDKAGNPWPHLRREVPHNWYCDRRRPLVGFLDRDEVLLLYNLALQFRGKGALEVGCWMGWSTCHLALAGVALDVLDPVLAESEHGKSVRESLAEAGVLASVRLFATSSPAGVRALAEATDTRWSLFFIDGDHEAPAPERDARECMQHAADDAMIVFHDLVSPDVEKGLDVLRRAGWNVLVYQTMQIVGVAWRGQVRPVAHVPDPAIAWSLPAHLAKYPVCGASPEQEVGRLSIQLAAIDREVAARDDDIARLQRDLASGSEEVARLRAGLGARAAELASAREELGARKETAARLRESAAGLEQRSTELERLAAARQTEVERLEGERARLASDLVARVAELANAREKLGARNATIARLREDAAGLELRSAERERLVAARQAELERLEGERARLACALALRHEEIACLSEEAERLGSEVRALHGSTSWRVTAPMRGLKNAGLRLRSSLRRTDVDPTPSPPPALPLDDDVALISRSGLFDPEHCAAQSPGFRESGLDPLVHYLTRGAAEGIDPHPLFDASFYCEQTPALPADVNPLVHYLRNGSDGGRDPHRLFDTSFYCERNPEVVESGENPLVHYLRTGAAEGRDPHPLFDSSYYRAETALDPGVNPLLHYLAHGSAERRNPHPLFEASFYLEQKPHVVALGVNPLVHFLTEGSTDAFDPLSSPRSLPDGGICIVTPDIVGPVKNGGIGTACYHFARLLAEDDQPVTILFTGELSACRRAHWRNVYAGMGINFVSLSDTPPVTRLVYGSSWFLEKSWRVFQYLQSRSYSLVHFQDWHANGFWSIKAKQVGLAFDRTTLTVMAHSCTKWIDEGMQRFGPEPIETAKLVWAETYAIEHCDVLLSPSRYMLDWLSQNGIRTPKSVVVAPNAYTEHPERDGQPREVDNDHLVFFGRLETRKGLHVFGDALRLLRRQGGPMPRALSFLGTLDEVNGQPAAEYLDALRQDLAPVEFCVLNHLDHAGALEYIDRTRGFVVLPSLLDNCPLVVIECIENGFPFLAATTGGIPDMVDRKATFEPTPSALAARLVDRHRIDHAAMRHPYSAREAARTWRDLHDERGPLGGAGRASQGPARDLGDPPRVSVCIPFFEHHRYLASLVAAFEDQSYADLEVVVVNDGSGPEASQEFDRVAARTHDARFRFLTTENRGPGGARNTAAEAATGEVLLFFDADNLPKSHDFVTALVRALRRSGADCVTCPHDQVTADRLVPTERDVQATYRPWGPCLEAGFFENVLGDSAMIVSRSVFERVGGFPTGHASWEDQEFLLRLCFQGFRLETFPEALFYYRLSPSGRNRQANPFLNYRSLFDQLQAAPSAHLARIIAAVGGPMLVARFGVSSDRRVGN